MAQPKPDPLDRALTALLKPLVRLVLKRGMAFGRFAEIVKRAYVEAAKSDFVLPGRKLSISRVAVLTGLTRKEASRLLQRDPDQDDTSTRRQINRAARVVSAWVEESRYQDDRGAPAPLPFDAAEGPSFSDLVITHGADVTPRAVLDELARVGAIDRLADDRIRLVEPAYIPSTDEAAKLAILGADVADLVAAIEHNLDPGEAPAFFQRKVAYDNLPADYLPALRALLADKGQRLLRELNADMARRDRDVVDTAADPKSEDRRRAMIGIYYFEDDDDGED